MITEECPNCANPPHEGLCRRTTKPECTHVFTGQFPPFAQFHCTSEVVNLRNGKHWCAEHQPPPLMPIIPPEMASEWRIEDAKERVIAAAKAWRRSLELDAPGVRVELARAVDALIAAERERA